jgi:integrase
MPVRTIQAVIASLARLTRVPVSADTLRHTFALGYLRDNPGKLVELAGLLGHESLDTTAVYRDHPAMIWLPTWSAHTSMSAGNSKPSSPASLGTNDGAFRTE